MAFKRQILAGLVFGGDVSRAAMICIVVAGTTLSLIVPAAAQEGATCGMVETAEGPQFWGACPNQQSHAPVFTGTWYAAIARSTSSPFWGASWHEKSWADAENNGLSRCEKGAHSSCKVVVQGVNAFPWRRAIPTVHGELPCRSWIALEQSPRQPAIAANTVAALAGW